MSALRVGFAMCGSFCTFKKALSALEHLVSHGYDVYPIMSEVSYATDTRFGKASDFIAFMETQCGHPVIHTIPEAEPIGPKALLDVMAVIPCTGNTLAKLACGVTDTCVTMACKAHLRNERPVVIAVSSNDALAANWQNIGRLAARKNIYFVPFEQDDPQNKTTSLVARVSLLIPTIEAALEGRQLQPLLLETQ